MSKIAPSILAADTMRMGEAARAIRDAGADYVHFDVMDGVFVPNISFGPQLLRDMNTEIDMYFDVHLMLSDPLPYVDVFAQSGAGGITVHVEAAHFTESLARIRALGLRTGASLRPGTPAEALREALPGLDLVLVMTVEPGFGGQSLNAAMYDKIHALRSLGFTGEIEVDGGVNPETARRCIGAGATVLVAGSAVFHAKDPADMIRQLRCER